MASMISLEELHLYHKIDRDIFSRLVTNFNRDPAESLVVMALWLWLEDKNYPNIIVKMVGLPDALVGALANEAVLCLKCLESNLPRAAAGIPLTAALMERDISLQMFTQNKFSAITGIKSFLNNICCHIFTDILQHVLPPAGANSQANLNHPLFGAITVVLTPVSSSTGFSAGGLWDWQPADGHDVSEDDRTMFLTFSRGFPVLEEEVKELFTELFGDCVESVQMETVPSSEQPLYARMVLRSVTFVDRMLKGKRISKFRVNGKHIWARKYERRDQ
ncbi:uncharacterized protein LOC132189624 [Corylus avellana]|uniref:uncharacterized protein LOC132189624 n=1 Tax=Corylus avellana TaxID=13451 RepID=UPI001E1F55C1|nr:uncharacterized protein LOC132189624 [Corylus avellana]